MYKDLDMFELGHAEGVAAASDPRAGFGRCSSGDCPCQAFEGGMSANNCTNCGHAYSDHW
jgi:hypothetical protein